MSPVCVCVCVCVRKRARAHACVCETRRGVAFRTLLRFLPVEKVCHASLEAIGKAAQELLPAHFPSGTAAEPLTYAVQYEHRASVNLDRMDLINKVVESIDKVGWEQRPLTSLPPLSDLSAAAPIESCSGTSPCFLTIFTCVHAVQVVYAVHAVQVVMQCERRASFNSIRAAISIFLSPLH
jgi:THUMP domain